jgi:hypothetical protein
MSLLGCGVNAVLEQGLLLSCIVSVAYGSLPCCKTSFRFFVLSLLDVSVFVIDVFVVFKFRVVAVFFCYWGLFDWSCLFVSTASSMLVVLEHTLTSLRKHHPSTLQ